ncbi:MAG: DNA mismatch repair endonuclease MutL [Verrucomicrobiales bacterium]|jgi:DNA mismatch repair protein MutL|nr:DNA mismatch repair endonuclease MutL [bacterium]MDF1784399.1 DNA mismatch repair endonuclease MutL [Verrucomicrobiales bacterium]
MGKIQLLSDTLASQVAAGEVVERPASVVKELIENSIDAGARNIEMRVRRGGISSIQIADDGCGMDKTDALMSLERHATSKLRESSDLESILTMGFRGEALPSIASVSKFRLTTRETNALEGTEILINGGKLISVKEAGEAPGTQIEARSLFYNMPARRKFLRTENTEFSHIEHQVRVHAIAHPRIRFLLVHNERTTFHLPATESLFERVRGLVGNELAMRLLEIRKQERNGIKISGFIGQPGVSRSNRSLQMIFLNRRPVEGAMLQYALREGYHTALMKGQQAVTFLFLEMDPRKVDVNVHPAKREVRFHDGNTLKSMVADVVAETLEQRESPSPNRVRETPAPEELSVSFEVSEEEDLRQESLIPELEQQALRKDWSPLLATDAPPEPAAVAPEEAIEQPDEELIEAPPEPVATQVPKAKDFRILGVIGKLYVLMENTQGLVLMDQHAAHERILFEQMRSRMETEGVPTQSLLMPVTIEMTPKDFDLVREHVGTLQKLGIGAEVFGANTLKIDSLPTFVSESDSNRFINDVLEELPKDTGRMSSVRLGEDMVATTVCRHAVKANDDLHPKELEKLLEDLLDCELPFCCPHGRPTLVQISFKELEKKFGRVV